MPLREKPLRIVSISDIHLGHLTTETASIITNLRTYFLPKLAECDLLLVDGDVFDSGLGLSDADTGLIIAFFIELFILCDQLGIIIRFVRGTFSHDRKQCENLVVLHQKFKFTNSLRYFDTVSLEYIDELNLRMLYLPDDLPYKSADEVIALAKSKMADMGWDTVDYACVHSYFDHHLPPDMPHKPKICYTAAQFEFVTRYVFCGHVHQGGQTGHILTNGSTDRLSHGDEGKKGFFYVVDDGEDALITHVENKGAAIYATKDLCEHTDPQAAIQSFLEWARSFPSDRMINLRAIHGSSEVRTVLGRIMLKEFPHVRYRQKVPSGAELEAANPPPMNTTVHSTPTRDNLPELILNYHLAKGTEHTLTADAIGAILDNL